jgi:hypothetical protein
MFEGAEFTGYLILDVTAIRVNFAEGTGREACDTFGWLSSTHNGDNKNVRK